MSQNVVSGTIAFFTRVARGFQPRDRGPERAAPHQRGQRIATALVAVLMCAQPTPAQAYLKFGVRVGTREVTLKWNRTPVRYFVTDRGVAGVSAQQFQAAVTRAFQTW